MDITKVKVDPKKGVLVRYDDAPEEPLDDGSIAAVQHVTVECEDAPHPDLLDAMGALREVVEDVCLLPPGYCARMDVRGVTLVYNADGDVQVTITGLRPVADDRLFVVNTPLFEPSGAHLRLVDDVRREARRYVQGKRAQASLFDSAQMGDGRESGIDSITISSIDPETGERKNAVTLTRDDVDDVAYRSQKTAGRA